MIYQIELCQKNYFRGKKRRKIRGLNIYNIHSQLKTTCTLLQNYEFWTLFK